MECFCVNSQEIENRIDPYFYRPKFRNIEKSLKGSTFDLLGNIASFQYGLGETAKNKGDVIYIRITDIDEFGNLKKEILAYLDFVPKYENYILEKGDVLVARTGATFGKSFYFDDDFKSVFAGYLIRIKLNDNVKLISKYLFYFMQTKAYWLQARQIMTGGGQPQFNANTIAKLKIPIPPLEIQNKIVSLMDKAYSSKKLKETESQKLLDSINDYVLDELGIKLLKSEDKMCFTVSFEEVETGRIDPISFAHPQDTPSSEKFKEKSLGEVAKLVKGQSITKENITSGDYPVIAGGQSSPYSIDNFNHKGNIITVSASGAYSGYVWYHDYSIFASDCTVIKSLEEKEISTFYLFCVMKAKQKFVYNMQQGAGQPHVYSRDLSKLNIPLPPLSVQNKIADEVKKRKRKAETLQKEAKEELEKAKSEVEKIILS